MFAGGIGLPAISMNKPVISNVWPYLGQIRELDRGCLPENGTCRKQLHYKIIVINNVNWLLVGLCQSWKLKETPCPVAHPQFGPTLKYRNKFLLSLSAYVLRLALISILKFLTQVKTSLQRCTDIISQR